MTRSALAVALASALLPAAAMAAPAFSLRGGWAPSFGDAAANAPMSEIVRAQIPLQVDFLWRWGPLAAGAYGSWGLALAGCDPGARCSASSARVGAEATWTFPTANPGLEPWAGAGAGYEWTARRRERAGTAVDWTYRGPEILSLQGGADFRVERRIAIGPFLLLALGRYSHLSLDTPEGNASGEIAGRAFHAWLEVGVRGTFDP